MLKFVNFNGKFGLFFNQFVFKLLQIKDCSRKKIFCIKWLNKVFVDGIIRFLMRVMVLIDK